MENKKIKIVVTGGAGFIGSNLTDELVRKEFDVHVIDNLSSGKKENVNKKAKLHVLDVTNLKSIEPIFKNAKYVFHLAALPSVQCSIEHPTETNKINLEGIINILVASQKAGVQKVIYSSSASIYGDQETMPLNEKLPAMPKSPYGLQKYAGELYCRLWSEIFSLPTVSLRYFNVYGPRQNAEGAYALVIPNFLKQISENKPMTVTGDGKQTRDFINVRDVVGANILAMESGKVGNGEVINVGSGKRQSIIRIAQLVGGPVKHIPARLELRDSLADVSLAKKLLGWVPKIGIETGIEELKKCHGK